MIKAYWLVIIILFCQSSMAWTVSVESIDMPKGQRSPPKGKKIEYPDIKNINYDIPDLDGFSCTLMANPYKQVHFRDLNCNTSEDRDKEFSIRVTCSDGGNYLHLTRTKKNRILGHTITASCL